jgi:geranylgeranyl diphosphate synthase type II
LENWVHNLTLFQVKDIEIKKEMEEFLGLFIPAQPVALYNPVRASLAAGGKRARPRLTAIWSGSSSSTLQWVPAGAAVELLHAFTLVHDDIMDHADLRRGQPTIHIAYGTNEAILAGDVMIALALEALARCEDASQMLPEFAIGFRGVCEGQALDKEFELRNDISVSDYLTMIELKTSRLFELSAALGAIAAGGTYLSQARLFARELGLAFQIQDDLLDLTGTPSFGKTIGGDVVEGKRTILFVLAMQQYDKCSASERQLLDALRERKANASDVPAVRSLFEKIGVLQKASKLAAEHANRAITHISKVTDMEMLEQLLVYTRDILGPALADRAITLADR